LKVFELAKKLSRSSKEILSAADYLQISVKSHLSNLTEQEVNKIIKYFKKKRILFCFKKYFSVFIVLILIVVFIVINSQTPASGEINGSVNAQGELTLDWSFESPVEEGVILVESESELLIIEVDDSNGTVTECCFQEDLEILLLFTDDDDDIVEVESVNISLPEHKYFIYYHINFSRQPVRQHQQLLQNAMTMNLSHIHFTTQKVMQTLY
jgi:hypothetical protein